MPARSSARHLFVSPTGEALPRWRVAFPAAEVTSLKAATKVSRTKAVVWLRLDGAQAATDQLAQLYQSLGEVRVIVLADQPDGDEALSLFSAGVRGYCNAHATAASLRQIAGVIEAGGLWIGESLMKRLVVSTRAAISRLPVAKLPLGPVSGEGSPMSALTKREVEVARAVASGASNKEVARQCGITERTVKAHVGSVFQNLKARDRLHLALMLNGQRPS